MDRILSSKKQYIITFAVLLLALQAIFNYSWSYWKGVSEFYYYDHLNGVVRSITAVVENLFLAFVFEKFLEFYKKDREESFLLFLVMLVASLFMILFNLDIHADGNIICFSLWSVNIFH